MSETATSRRLFSAAPALFDDATGLAILFKSLTGEECYATLMDLVNSNHPLLASYSSASEVVRVLDSHFFARVNWFGTGWLEEIVKLPVPFIVNIFKSAKSGSSWWDAEGSKLLNSGLLDVEKMKVLFADLVRLVYAPTLGYVISHLKDVEAIRCFAETFLEQYKGDDFFDYYKTNFMCYVKDNPNCPTEILMEALQVYFNDGSSSDTEFRWGLFNALHFYDGSDAVNVVLPELMKVVSSRCDFVSYFILSENNKCSLETKADVFIKYYSPSGPGPFMIISSEIKNIIEPLVGVVKRRLYEEAAALLPGVDVTSMPLEMLIESVVDENCEGYRYLLEIKD